MSNNVGTLIRKKHPENGVYFEGAIHLEQVVGRAFLVPQPKRSENSPDFKLRVKRANGVHDYGSAWLGKMRGPDGGEYVSISIAAPGIGPIYVKAFPADAEDRTDDAEADETVFNVIWNPTRSAAAAPRGNGGGTPAMDDEIPF